MAKRQVKARMVAKKAVSKAPKVYMLKDYMINRINKLKKGQTYEVTKELKNKLLNGNYAKQLN